MTDTHAVSRSGAEAGQDRQPATRNGTNGATERRMNGNERGSGRDEATLLPPVDVVEDATAITLFADLPGVPKDKLDIRVEAETLTIDGELSLPMPQGMSSSHAEVQVTRYRRTFTLSKELDAEQVDAEFNNGVLRLRIPKARDAQPRRIEVRVH
jgi:HSP20 family molecular chaperone IbpA